MNEESSLIVIAEIAAALAGFSGIAATFGRRADNPLSEVDRRRLNDLLSHSGIALFASLVPLALAHKMGNVEASFWVISSSLWALFALIAIVRTTVTYVQEGVAGRILQRMLVLGVFVGLFSLQLINIFLWNASWPYLIALVGNLAFAFFQFMGIVNPVIHGGR